DHAGLFVARQVGAAEFAHLRFGQLRVFPDDDQLHRFAHLLIGDANHGTFHHARHGRHHFLHLVGVDVEAADQHHVLFAVYDLEVAALVHDADIARLEEAVFGHDLGGLVGALPVASHHLRAL